jgi:hypothetical protein
MAAMLTAAKDAFASRAAQIWANNLIGRYGKVESLQIDSQRKTVEVSCLLDGEATVITVRIENYIIEADMGKRFIRATKFCCNRPWLQRLLTDFCHRQRIELPPVVAAVF